MTAKQRQAKIKRAVETLEQAIVALEPLRADWPAREAICDLHETSAMLRHWAAALASELEDDDAER